MAYENPPFSARRGDDRPLVIPVRDDNEAIVDPTGATVRFTYGYTPDGAALVTKTDGAGVSVGTGDDGTGQSVPVLLVQLNAAEMLALEAFRTYFYQVVVSYPNTNARDTVCTGSFTVDPSQDPVTGSIVVEDGSGLPNAVSYVSLAVADAYHLARGNTGWFGAGVSAQGRVAALVRATAFLDNRYRTLYSGIRVKRRQQALEWPRTGAYALSDPIEATEIPRELVEAVCEAALREASEPGSLAPDQTTGDAIQSVTAGSATVTFAGEGLRSSSVSFPAIDMVLAPLLTPVNPYVGSVGRG